MFARAPLYGAVKTRLARDVGNAEALRFYRDTLQRLVRRLDRDPRHELVLAVTPDRAAHDSGMWPDGPGIVGQGKGDLGQRMLRVLRMAGTRPAMIIGSDIPGINAASIAKAAHTLGSHAHVLGPARDGGYWLIGARHPTGLRIDALEGVRWSGPHALADTMARLDNARLLDVVLDDVDDGAGLLAARRT
jgi:rSAM/selenodomain-associated transferase 1